MFADLLYFLLLLLLFVTLRPKGRQLCPQKLGNSILGWIGKHIGMGRLISVRIYPIHVKTGYSKHIVIRPITIVTYVYSLKCYYKPCIFHIIKRNTRLPINRFFHRFKSNNGIIQFPNSTSIDRKFEYGFGSWARENTVGARARIGGRREGQRSGERR